MQLFTGRLGQFKTSLYETARGLLRSRNNQAARAERLAEQLRQQKAENARLERALCHERREQQRKDEQLRAVQQENRRLRSQAIVLPDDPPLPNHSYGPRMISLCVTLAKRIGFRPCEEALQILFDWLGVEANVPAWTSIRTWLCRIGVDGLHQALEPHDDWLWMVDHSNQIGKEKVLTILGVRTSQLPAPGQTLRHKDVHVLAVVPGTQWKRDDVREQYKKLAARVGSPRILLSDGAVELRESADVLKKAGRQPILLRDLKHFSANALERMLGRSDRFQTYLSKLGRTRSAVQQTELSHFTPPPPKNKARFMNLEPMLRWGEMISWHLAHPQSEARQSIPTERMNEKLGWLRDFRADLAQWRRIQRVIDETLQFVNTQGLYRGAATALRQRLDELRCNAEDRCEQSDQMVRTLIQFVADSEKELAEGERGWLSTEILESSFGLYKALEGQHSKGGFTSLLASFAALLSDCTPGNVRDSFRRVSTKDMKKWVSDNLGRTLSSKRAGAYRESAPSVPVSIKPG